MVHDGYAAGRRLSHNNVSDFWEELWDAWDIAYAQGWIILLHKVKSHTTIAQIDVDIPAEHRTGNALADHWAGVAASQLQTTEQQDSICSDTDITAWVIQSRLVAICQTYLESHKRTTKDPKPIQTAEQITTIRLEELGHIPVLSEGWWRCSICLQQVRQGRIPMLINKGRRPGPNVWNAAVGQGRWEFRRGHKATINGVAIHVTHCTRWYRGLYYCSLCGSYAVTRVEGLSRRCQMRPPNQAAAGRLKRILDGKFPTHTGVWTHDIDSYPVAHL